MDEVDKLRLTEIARQQIAAEFPEYAGNTNFQRFFNLVSQSDRTPSLPAKECEPERV